MNAETLALAGAKLLLGEQNYYAAGLRLQLARAKLQGKTPLYVHVVGKVGSTAIVRSLRGTDAGRDVAVFQSHYLTPEGTRFLERLYEDGFGGWDQTPSRSKRHIIRSRTLGDYLCRERAHGTRFQVLTLVRDPVATNISGLFHNYAWWPQDVMDKCAQRSPDCMERLLQFFLERYPHEAPLTWFDTELRPMFGVDVFATEFATDQGYQIYHGEFSDLLLFKLEKLNQCAPEAIGSFLHVQGFALARANVGEDKSYASLYDEFKRTVALPGSYLDRMYRSKLVQHFYGQDEIDRFRSRWSGGPAATPAATRLAGDPAR